jgi:cyclopropane-fatty-acyl-phospholipid synthase
MSLEQSINILGSSSVDNLEAESRILDRSTNVDLNAWQRFFKGKFLDHVAKLKGGALHWTDAEGTQVLGTGDRVASVIIHDPSVYSVFVLQGTMGIAEAYMDGKWESDDLFSLFAFFARERHAVESLDGPLTKWARPLLRFGEVLATNTLNGSRKNIQAHYDLGNEMFELFLDPTMTYSSAYFLKENMSLKEASIAKLDRMCQQLELKETDHLLEIGSGWGSMAMHAAQNYGCRVTTLTLSVEQKALAEERIASAGLSDCIEVLLRDYREMDGVFDKLVSIEMIEAVGHQYLGTYFSKIDHLLKPNGIAAIQAITVPDQAYGEHLRNVDFIQKYIFPGSKIPCVGEILKQVSSSSSMTMTDLKDIGIDYSKTMLMWRKDFVENLDKVRSLGYDERFIKMWDYYLNYCAAGFSERYLGTVQMQFRKCV